MEHLESDLSDDLLNKEDYNSLRKYNIAFDNFKREIEHDGLSHCTPDAKMKAAHDDYGHLQCHFLLMLYHFAHVFIWIVDIYVKTVVSYARNIKRILCVFVTLMLTLF